MCRLLFLAVATQPIFPSLTAHRFERVSDLEQALQQSNLRYPDFARLITIFIGEHVDGARALCQS